MIQNEPPVPADSMSPDKANLPNMVPYERFAEVNRQLKDLRAEMAALKGASVGPEAAGAQAPAVNPEDIYRRMVEDPESYLKEMMSGVAQRELQMLRHEMELQSALKAARQKYPELATFENYVLQEIMGLLEKDPTSENLTWDEILEKGVDQVKSRFKDAMGKKPEQLTTASVEELQKAQFEGGASRKPQPIAPNFTRSQIANMSLDEFLKNESAINEAMKNNRIK